MRSRALLLVTLFLASSLTALALAPAAEAAGGVVAVATRVEGRYGSEAWKDENPALGDLARSAPVPVPGAPGVYRNPYRDPLRPHGGPGAAWLGSSLVVALELNSTTGEPLDPGANHYVEAALLTPWGSVPAKLTRLGPTIFEAQLDLDGEPGKPWPNLLAPGRSGTHELVVTVKRPGTGPAGGEVNLGTSVVPIATRAATVDVPGATGAFPQASVPGYADLGAPFNVTTLRWNPVRPNETVTATFRFGEPFAEARVDLWNGAAGFTVFNGTTDGAGDATFTFDASAAVPSGGAIAVLAGHLAGDRGVLAAAHQVLLVSERAPRIVEVGLGNAVPRDGSPAMMHATLRDPGVTAQTASRRATLVLLAGTDVLGTAEFAPATPDAPEFRTATFNPALVTSRGAIERYEVLAFLFDGNNRFHGFARATRGFTAQVLPAEAYAGERSYVRVQVTNLNDNHDDRRGALGDPGLALTFRGEVSGLPGGTAPFEVTVDEGNTTIVEVPIVPSDVGAHTGQVNLTAAELRATAPASLVVQARPGALEGLFARIPAPGPLGLLAVLAVTALAAAAARPRRAR